MCLIAFALNADPACPLLIAANRDEFFERPTAPLQRWPLVGSGELLAGRDLREGGTWLGVNSRGRVAMLTNVRSNPIATRPRSRGELASRWLEGDLSWAQLQANTDPRVYGGFNLVVGDFFEGFWACLSNRDPLQPHSDAAVGTFSRHLGPGFYGLSNAALDTPWPKTQRLTQALRRSVAQLGQPDGQWRSTLTQALADTRTAAAAELPDTGVPGEWEQGLSSPFVRLPERGYGTRSSLVLRVAAESGTGQRVTVDEWTHAPEPNGEHRWSDAQRRSDTLVW
jgi:uncharacterized protein with NRDE domain